MALTGLFSKYATGYFGLACDWYAVQNIPGNYSDVTVNVYLQHYSITAKAKSNSTIKCGSETYTYTSPSVYADSGSPLVKTFLGSHTFRVYHDSNGYKSVTLSASWSFNGTYSGTYVGTITASTTVTLDQIPRQSTVGVVTVEGMKVTVNLNRFLTGVKHTVKFSFGTYSHTVGDIESSTSYTIPLEWLNAIPNSASGTGGIEVTTYLDNSQIGVVATSSFVITAPDTVVPTIGGISWAKTSSEPSGWPMLKGISQGTMVMTGVAGAYGSTIVAYSLSFAGLSSNTVTLPIVNIAYSGTLGAIAKVTDSRGRSATKTVLFTVSDYAKPRLTVSAFRCDNTGAEDASGDSFLIKANVEIAQVLGQNNRLDMLMLHYKKKSDLSYQQFELEPDDNTILVASSDSAWEWMVVAEDLISSVDVKGSIPTGEVVLDILANGKGIKFGGVADKEGLDIDGAWPLMVDGIPQVDFVVEQGTSGVWTYRKWNSGIAECWGYHSLSGMDISTAWGTWYHSPEIRLPSYPFPFIELPSISLGFQSGTSAVLDGLRDSTTSSPGATYLYRPFTEVGLLGKITLYVCGRWK